MFDYKKIIKNRSTRLKILRALSFIPDKTMVSIQYRIKTGHRLNLKNPQRFTEKMQCYKLFYKDPLMVQCVDKYDVRQYVKSKGLEEILIPCIGVYEASDMINWCSLPNQFVMKDTLGGGGTSVVIVKDKSQVEFERLKAIASSWISSNEREKASGREWPYYSGKKHRVIIEELIEDKNQQRGLIDYKFFCIDGKVEFIYVMGDRKIGESVKVSILDRDFNLLPVTRVGDEVFTGFEKPNNFNDMIRIAETLAKSFPHVRVDLYNVNGKILFGELTFFNASGYMQYEPDQFDYEIGKKWSLPGIFQ